MFDFIEDLFQGTADFVEEFAGVVEESTANIVDTAADILGL